MCVARTHVRTSAEKGDDLPDGSIGAHRDPIDPMARAIQLAKRTERGGSLIASSHVSMRLPFVLLALIGNVLFACAAPPPPDPGPSSGQLFDGQLPPQLTSTPTPASSSPSSGNQAGGPGAATKGTTPPAAPVSAPTTPTVTAAPGVDPQTVGYPEVVQLVMPGRDGNIWFCTGALISSTVAVTAAHCLQSDLMLSWQVIAPTIAGTPKVTATRVAMYDDQWAAAEHPDVGIVILGSPIELPQYAVLTDVSAQVDGGQQLQVQTIVRTAEEPEAPFHMTGTMPLSSAVKYGYTHGYSVPIYSHGGDSGAGMFLVENGVMSHKVVAIESEPDPQRKLDQISRVEQPFIDWVAQQTAK
jgi:hypothetical protein